jgi:hypothetical protein
MLEELVALALLEDRRRRLESVILFGRSQAPPPREGKSLPTFPERIAGWLQPRELAAIVPHEIRLEAQAWRIK